MPGSGGANALVTLRTPHYGGRTLGWSYGMVRGGVVVPEGSGLLPGSRAITM